MAGLGSFEEVVGRACLVGVTVVGVPAMDVDAAGAIDLERYPLHGPGSTRYGDLIRSIHGDLARLGCAKLYGFVKHAAC